MRNGTTGGMGGGMFGGGGPGDASAMSGISSWVQSNFTSTTVGGITLYDLSNPAANDGTTVQTDSI